MRTVGFYTLGCKVNQYETARIAEIFKEKGYVHVEEGKPADVYVVNTCTVTRLADRKSRQMIRRAKRLNPSCVLVAMGCYPQTNLAEVGQLEEIDIIVGTSDKGKILQYVEEYIADRKAQTHVTDLRTEKVQGEAESIKALLNQKTRALINVQNGCNRFCSYCVIPYARGPVRSLPLEKIIQQAQALLSQGCKELVLTGINTALYGTEPGFEAPVEGLGGIEIVIRALNELPGDFRIRLGSLEPTVVDARYVRRLLQYDKLCPHLHLSAQSGSDRILEAMNRNYRVCDYLDIVDAVRAYDSLYGLTTDIIVGFPGETEEDFASSLALVEKAGYHKVHGFQYSRRLFTAAAEMDQQVPPPVKKERNARLLTLAENVSLKAREMQVGKSFRILVEDLVEDCRGKTFWKGHSEYFVLFYIPYVPGENLINQFVRVVALHPLEEGMLGQKEE